MAPNPLSAQEFEEKKRQQMGGMPPSAAAPRPMTFDQCSASSNEPSARDLLLQRAEILRVKAKQLEALADQLPTRMTPEAARGLIQLLIQ
jgi:hypothetical protein